MFRNNKTEIPRDLCFKFSSKLLESSSENIQKSLKDLKLLGIQTMIYGFASKNCPVMRLTEICPDIVMIAPEVTAYTDDRNKPSLIPSFVQFMKSVGVEVMAEGKLDKEQKRTLGRIGVLGICDGVSVMTAEEIEESLEREEI